MVHRIQTYVHLCGKMAFVFKVMFSTLFSVKYNYILHIDNLGKFGKTFKHYFTFNVHKNMYV